MPKKLSRVNAFQREIATDSLGSRVSATVLVESQNMNIADLRQEYMRAGLTEAQADADPIRQFERWFEDALRAKLPLPNAMTLATVTPQGAPSARIVLLKGVENGGFLFYTNYLSRKGRELEASARACLLSFLLRHLGLSSERTLELRGN